MKKCFFILLVLLSIPLYSINVPELLTTVKVKSDNTSGGNLVADAVANCMDCDLALVGTCDLKEMTMSSCELTEENTLGFLSLPESKLGIIEVTGEMLKKIILKSVQFYPKSNPAFLQVAGINVDVNLKSEDKIMSFKINGENLVNDKIYKVAMTEELGAGANGYWKIWDPKLFKESEKTIKDALCEYVSLKSIRNCYIKRIIISK